MHRITKNELESLARWTQQTANGDSFAIALQAGIPERGEGSYASLTGNFGSLSLDLYEAESLDEITPYLQLACTVGFKREGEGHPEEDSAAGTMTWRCVAPIEGEDTRQQRLAIRLHLKQGAVSCRYVEIGKKEVPDMKLLCGQELEDWNKANPS